MPQKQLLLPIVRGLPSAVLGELLTVWEFYRFVFNQDFAYLSMPFVTPDDLDNSRPCNLYMYFSNSIANATSGLFLRLVLQTVVAVPGAAIQAFSDKTFDWPVPNPWPVDQVEEFHVAAPGADTFTPGSFDPGNAYAFRFNRLGTNASDTYPNNTQHAAFFRFVYYIRCQRICC